MKKLMKWVVFCLVAMACVTVLTHKTEAEIYRPPVGSELTTVTAEWVVAGTFSAAATNDLGNTERTYTLVDALISTNANGDGNMVLYKVPYGTNVDRFRVIGTTNNHDFVVNVYSAMITASTGNASLVKRGTLTCVIGQQLTETATYEFADTMVLSADEASATAWTITNPANDTCAEAFIDMQGDNVLCFVPTTVDSAMKILIKFY